MCTLVESMGRIPTKDVRTLALAVLFVAFAYGQSPCPAGMYLAWGETWCCTSKCGPGTKIVLSCTHDNRGNTVCKDCGPDYYNPYPDQFHCRRKDLCNRENEEVKVPGTSTTNNECQCQIGFYDRAELCLRGDVCPPGSGVTRTGECETCPHGTFSNLTSHVQPCIKWQSCGTLGFLRLRPGTSTSDAVCISHPLEVLLPTERPEINVVTHKDAVNSTNSMTGGRQPTELVSAIVGISVGVPVLVLVVLLVQSFCRKTQQEIVLQDGQLDDSKTPLGVQEEDAANYRQIKGGSEPNSTMQYSSLISGTGVESENNAFPGRYTNALPDRTSIEMEERITEEETLPMKPRGGDERDNPSAMPVDNAPVTNTTVTGDNNIYVTAGDNAVIHINQDPK